MLEKYVDSIERPLHPMYHPGEENEEFPEVLLGQ